MPCPEHTWDAEDSLIAEVTEIHHDGAWKRHRLPAGVASITAAVIGLVLWTGHGRPMDRIDVAAATCEELIQRIPSNGSELEVWGKKFVSDAVEHAKGLPDQPLRNLKDVFYQEIQETSEDYPFIRTECVIDTVQATTYLMEGIVNLYRAIDQRGQKCVSDGRNDVRCAVNVIGFITCMSWVAAYLSLAASACAQAVNPGALCAADWTTIAGAFGEIAYAGAGVRQDCKIYGKWAKRKGYGLSTTRRPYLRFFPDARRLQGTPPSTADAANAVLPGDKIETIYKFDLLNSARRYRKFDITACVAEAFQAASFLIRALLQIRDSAQACPDPRNCAINIMNVISSFSWISHFSVQAVDDCATLGSQEARCGAEISALIAALMMSPAAGYATTSDCAKNPDPKYELLHEPTP